MAGGGTISPSPWLQFSDAAGVPYAGGSLAIFEAGTNTPANTWADQQLTVLNPNPIPLDAAGECVLYLNAAAFKYELYDADGALIKTQDNVPATGLSSSGIGNAAFMFGGDITVPITAAAYPSGTTFDKCLPGSSFYAQDSNNLSGTYVLTGMLKSIGGVTVTVGLFDLTDGTPDTPLVEITSVSAVGELQTSPAIVFPAGGTDKTYAVKGKVSGGGSGSAWQMALVRTS